MSKAAKYSLLSISLATGLFLVVLWIKCEYVPDKLRIPANTILNTQSSADTAIYFIGSSRVGNGIDAPFLQTTLGKPVHILSFAGGTFLANSILANHLLQQPGHKIILVELSSVTPNITAEFLTMLRVNRVSIAEHLWQLLKQDNGWEYRHFYLTLLNDVMLQHFNLNTDMKWIVGTKQPVLSRFKALQGNKVLSASSFLQPQQMQNVETPPSPGAAHLMQLVRMIQSTAAGQHKQVLFFSPLNFRSSGERPMVANVWQRLPETERIGYSDDWLKAVSRPEYLHDEIHLNVHGARVFSKGWVPVLDSLLHLRH
ncbi:MAG TPA: hypothetical protein VLL95_00950 [Phnomibacter sp.]|nr:hypothetical protein [Phnomibacter sp.]